MNRAFLKHFILIIIILSVCSGCKQTNNIIGDSFSIAAERPKAVKYKNGAILVTNDEQNNTTNRKKFDNPKINLEEIKFGPGNINFAN